MPLPVIFKFLTDTSGTRFDEVTDGLDGVKVSSQKAGQAVRSFTSVLRSGQEPVTALADSFSNLTRAFGLGVGATIAVVGVVEVIKSLTAESEKLNSVSDQINSTLKTFQESAGSLDLGGAITQVKSLGKAFEDARTKLGQRTDILGKVGTTIADTFFGGSRERAEAGLESLKAAQGQARFAASVALDKRIEAVQAGKVSKFAAETLAITEKYAKERRQAVDAGLIESDLRKLDILEIEELTKVARKEIDERGKAIQEQLDQEKQTTQRINELRIRDEEKIKNLRREGTSELLKGIESLNRGRLAGATPLLNRALEAAETLGIRGARGSVEQVLRKGEVGNAKAVLESLGITERDITARGELFPSAQEKFSHLWHSLRPKAKDLKMKIYSTLSLALKRP
jgi:vacuolar-type H+-ATPase subunit I/STV1